MPLNKKEGTPPVRASAEGLVHPEKEATNEETRPNGRAPRKCRFLLAEKYQFSAETITCAERKLCGALQLLCLEQLFYFVGKSPPVW